MARGEELEQEFWGAAAKPPGGGSKKRGKGALGLVVALLVAFAVFAYVGYRWSDSWLGAGLPREAEADDGNAGGKLGKVDSAGITKVLILGLDQRGKEPSRADTIILAFINAKEKTARLLSIPRDTYAEIPGREKQKINAAHAYGGPELMLQAVSRLVGTPVENYVEVNFEGFADTVDILGGINIDVEKRMEYPPEGIDLYPGPQVLNGDQALQYVRFRGDPLGDITRIQRQQIFIERLADKVFSVSAVWKVPQLTQEAYKNVRTNLGLGDMLSLARVFGNMSALQMEARMLPGRFMDLNKISYWEADMDEVRSIVSEFSERK